METRQDQSEGHHQPSQLSGVAAFNIGAVTLHAALLLGRSKFGNYQLLGHNRLNTLHSKLMLMRAVWLVVICY